MFEIPVCFINSNSDTNQLGFSYLTKLLNTFKVRPSLDAFHSQFSDEETTQQPNHQTTRILGSDFR